MTASTNQSSFRISSGWGESCLSRYSTTRQFTSSGTTPSSFRYPFRQKSIICRSLRVGLQSYVAPVKSSSSFFQKKLPFHSAVFPFEPQQAPFRTVDNTSFITHRFQNSPIGSIVKILRSVVGFAVVNDAPVHHNGIEIGAVGREVSGLPTALHSAIDIPELARNALR